MQDVIVEREAFDYAALPGEDARALKAGADRVRELGRRAVSSILEIGGELLLAKERLGHGRFGRWLDAEFNMTERTAQRYMSAAQWGAQKSDTVSVLEPTALFLLSAPSTPFTVQAEITRRIERGDRPSTADVRSLVTSARAEQAQKRKVELAKKTAPPAARYAAEVNLKPRTRREQRAKEQEQKRRQEKEALQAACHDLAVLLLARLTAESRGRAQRLAAAVGRSEQGQYLFAQEFRRALAIAFGDEGKAKLIFSLLVSQEIGR